MKGGQDVVDVKKLKAQMVLKGYSQKSLVAEMNDRGVKISVNTLSSKMQNPRKFNCEDADVICDILELKSSAEKSDIFLA